MMKTDFNFTKKERLTLYKELLMELLTNRTYIQLYVCHWVNDKINEISDVNFYVKSNYKVLLFEEIWLGHIFPELEKHRQTNEFRDNWWHDNFGVTAEQHRITAVVKTILDIEPSYKFKREIKNNPHNYKI